MSNSILTSSFARLFKLRVPVGALLCVCACGLMLYSAAGFHQIVPDHQEPVLLDADTGRISVAGRPFNRSILRVYLEPQSETIREMFVTSPHDFKLLLDSSGNPLFCRPQDPHGQPYVDCDVSENAVLLRDATNDRLQWATHAVWTIDPLDAAYRPVLRLLAWLSGAISLAFLTLGALLLRKPR